MKAVRRIMGHVLVGVLGTNCNTQIFWQTSNANNGTFANVVFPTTNATVTLTASNTEATIEVRADQLGNNNTWVQLVVLNSSNNGAGVGNVAACIYGGEAAYKPANQFDYTAIANNNRVVGL